jgi:D-alanine-D-alanine ligase
MDFSELPKGLPRIYGWQAKFDASTKQYDGTTAIVEKGLSPETRSRIAKAGREAAHALQVNDYARVDIRLSPDGTPFVIEVNANPYLENTSEFAQAALAAGINYTTLINRILETAWRRWEKIAPREKAGRPTRAAIRKRAGKIVPSCLREPENIEVPEEKEKPSPQQ